MNILVTLNSNYFRPLKVMLKSLFLNNPGDSFTIYVLHSSLTQDEINELSDFTAKNRSRLESLKIDENCFADAPILLHYTREMYFRLLAYEFLPKDLDRILYLDPDILVINPIRELYETDMEGYIYAAAYHNLVSVKEINKLRLYPYEISAYYNSGVLLMNLELQRMCVNEKEIFDFVRENRKKLIMPDQDVLNALYSQSIKTLDEKLYNYDARYYNHYMLTTNGLFDMDQIINHTVILHFCGKKKPWHKVYNGKFHSLYKHYEKQALGRF
jgi:lipopolysaccharide biosynthesis glycosyltransferase